MTVKISCEICGAEEEVQTSRNGSITWPAEMNSDNGRQRAYYKYHKVFVTLNSTHNGSESSVMQPPATYAGMMVCHDCQQEMIEMFNADPDAAFERVIAPLRAKQEAKQKALLDNESLGDSISPKTQLFREP